MKTTLLFFAMIFTVAAYSQFKNSDEKVIYSIDNAKVSSFKFAGGETAVEYNFSSSEQPFVLTGGNEVTAIKKNAWLAKVGLTNTKKFVDLDAFKFSEQGAVIGLSYLHSFDEVIRPTIGSEFNLWTYKVGVEFKFDNFNNYDPETTNADWKQPVTFSINASATRYFFHFDDGYTIAASFNGTYNPKTYNSSSLISFKDLDSAIVTPENVAVFKDVDGKYGTIDNDVSGGYLSLSLPVFFQYQPKKFYPYVVPVPYFSSQFLSSASPKYSAGIGIGIFAKSIFGPSKNTSIDAKTINPAGDEGITTVTRNSRTFNSPPFLTIGIDKSFQSKETSYNVFISGTITFE